MSAHASSPERKDCTPSYTSSEETLEGKTQRLQREGMAAISGETSIRRVDQNVHPEFLLLLKVPQSLHRT